MHDRQEVCQIISINHILPPPNTFHGLISKWIRKINSEDLGMSHLECQLCFCCWSPPIFIKVKTVYFLRQVLILHFKSSWNRDTVSQCGHPTGPDNMTLRRTLTPDGHLARHCADRLMDCQCLPPPTSAWTQGPEQSRSISCGFTLRVSLCNPVVITRAVLKQWQRHDDT